MNKEEIKQILLTNDKELFDFLCFIDAYMNDEHHKNLMFQLLKEESTIGFTSYDVKLLTSLSLHYRKGNQLSDNQIKVLRNRLPKYWKQYITMQKLEQILNS